jgi:hypothetical protein
MTFDCMNCGECRECEEKLRQLHELDRLYARVRELEAWAHEVSDMLGLVPPPLVGGGS